MDPVLGTRLAALALAAGAAALWFLGEPGAAIVLATAAVALPALAWRRPPVATEAAPLARLVHGMKIHGHGIHTVLPGGEGRLFLPAEGTGLPHLHPDQTIHRGVPSGLSLVPIGAALESQWAEEAGLLDGGGAEAFAVHARRAAAHFGGKARVEAAGNRLRVRLDPGPYAAACRAARHNAPWHLQGGCPLCSLIALLATRAHQAPVRFAACEEDGARTVLELEVLGGTLPP